jgi:hypothetical protein
MRPAEFPLLSAVPVADFNRLQKFLVSSIAASALFRNGLIDKMPQRLVALNSMQALNTVFFTGDTNAVRHLRQPGQTIPCDSRVLWASGPMFAVVCSFDE